jgi:monoamine oxidase
MGEQAVHKQMASPVAAQHYDVVVVGAGISGLHTASLLSQQGFKVLVLEATQRIGGRVRVDRLDDFAPGAPLHIGAEFLHGKSKSKIMDLIGEYGLTAVELPAWPDYLFYSVSDKHTHAELIKYDEAAEKDPKLDAAVEACCQLKHLPFSKDANKKDITTDRYLLDTCKISNRHFQLVDAAFANDMGESYANTGLDELIQENICWTYGDEYVIVPEGLDMITKRLSEKLNVRLNCPVTNIDYSKNQRLITVTHQNPNRHGSTKVLCKKVVITVSLGVLKAEMIQFSPPLPASKVDAIRSIGFASAAKIIIKFSQKFWPDDLFDVVCADSMFPELWTISDEHRGGKKLGFELVTFFVMGQKAQKLLSSLNNQQLIKACLDQMDQLFASQFKVDDESFNHASSPAHYFFMDARVFVWDEQQAPYTRGGYSYPTVNALGKRAELAKPVAPSDKQGKGKHGDLVDCRLFFAGEACNVGVNPCLHGALETAEIAVKSLIQSVAERPDHTSKL